MPGRGCRPSYDAREFRFYRRWRTTRRNEHAYTPSRHSVHDTREIRGNDFRFPERDPFGNACRLNNVRTVRNVSFLPNFYYEVSFPHLRLSEKRQKRKLTARKVANGPCFYNENKRKENISTVRTADETETMKNLNTRPKRPYRHNYNLFHRSKNKYSSHRSRLSSRIRKGIIVYVSTAS